MLEMRTIFHATRFVIVTYEYVTSAEQALERDGDSDPLRSPVLISCFTQHCRQQATIQENLVKITKVCMLGNKDYTL